MFGVHSHAGAKHQILPGYTTHKSHEDVVWMFPKITEPLIETEADAIIEMDIGEDLEHALTRAIDGIVRELGLPRPDAERAGKVLAKVHGYKTAHSASPNEPETKAKPKPAPRYFGFLLLFLFPAINEVLDRILKVYLCKKDPCSSFGTLSRRINASRASRTSRSCIASISRIRLRYGSVALSSMRSFATPPMFRARLGHVVMDERVVAVTMEEFARGRSMANPSESDSTRCQLSVISLRHPT